MFTNNLTQNDRVLDTVTKRQGKVARTPREGSRTVVILFDGKERAKSCDVMTLRFLVNGKPEDFAPVEGEPPARNTAEKKPPRYALGLLSQAKAERETNGAEMAGIEKRFKELRAQNDRLDLVIKTLSVPESVVTVEV